MLPLVVQHWLCGRAQLVVRQLGHTNAAPFTHSAIAMRSKRCTYVRVCCFGAPNLTAGCRLMIKTAYWTAARPVPERLDNHEQQSPIIHPGMHEASTPPSDH